MLRAHRPLGLSLVVLLFTATALAEDAPPRAGADDGDEAVDAEQAAKEAAAKKLEDAAKDAYTQAAKAAAAGKLEDALVMYRKADELVPAPAPKFKIAWTLDKLERFAEAEAAYEAFLDVKPDPDKFFSKIDSAKDRIRALHEMPGRIKVATVPSAPANLLLAVDRVPQAGNEIVVMPGAHNITAIADGWTGSQTITVGPAETKEVLLALVADRPPPKLEVPAPAAPVAPIIVQAPAAAVGPGQHQARTTAYVMFGIAGVQAVVGTIFAVQAMHAKSVYNAMPTSSTLESVDRQTVFADSFYATGLISVVTGVVLLLVDHSTSPSEAPVAALPSAPSKSKP